MNEEALNEIREALGIDTPDGLGLEVSMFTEPIVSHEVVEARLMLMSIDPGFVDRMVAVLDASPLAQEWRQHFGLREFRTSHIVHHRDRMAIPQEQLRRLLASGLAQKLAEALVTKIEWGLTRLDAEQPLDSLRGPQEP